MRDVWYGDNRDLVKWSVLVHLADRQKANRILHVAYWRPSQWSEIEIDGSQVPVPEPVLAHFRRIGNVKALLERPRVEVLESDCTNREMYLREVRRAVSATPDERTLVFLDPDTGLQPTRAAPEHVREAELRDIWSSMQPDDVLVFYQHQTNRSGAPWIEPKRRQFEACLRLPRGAARVAKAPSIARDVAFFYCTRVVT